jgi:hypothetical protein
MKIPQLQKLGSYIIAITLRMPAYRGHCRHAGTADEATEAPQQETERFCPFIYCMKPLGAGLNTVPVMHKIMFLEGRENCWSRDVYVSALSSLPLLSRDNRFQVNCGILWQTLSV